MGVFLSRENNSHNLIFLVLLTGFEPAQVVAIESVRGTLYPLSHTAYHVGLTGPDMVELVYVYGARAFVPFLSSKTKRNQNR